MTERAKRLYEIEMNFTSAINGTPYVSPSVHWLISEIRSLERKLEIAKIAFEKVTDPEFNPYQTRTEQFFFNVCRNALLRIGEVEVTYETKTSQT